MGGLSSWLAAAVSFIQSGANATLRTVQQELGQRYTLQQFGGICDGIADDTASINNTIAVVPAGAEIVIIGTPAFSTPLVINKKLRLTFFGNNGTAGTKPFSYFKKMPQCRGIGVTMSDAGAGGFIWDGGGIVGVPQVIALTQIGNVATAITATPHGWINGDPVFHAGATQPQYNVTANITVTGPNSYTYPIAGNPASPATGTPYALFAADGLWINDYRFLANNPYITLMGAHGIRIGNPITNAVNCDLFQLNAPFCNYNGLDGIHIESNTGGAPEANEGALLNPSCNYNFGNGVSMFASANNIIVNGDCELNQGYGLVVGGAAGTTRNCTVISGDYENNVLGQLIITANSFQATVVGVDNTFFNPAINDAGLLTTCTGGGVVTSPQESQSQFAIFAGTRQNVINVALINTLYDIPNTVALHGLIYFSDNTSGDCAVYAYRNGTAPHAIVNGIANFVCQNHNANNVQIEVTGGVTPRLIEFSILKSGAG